MSKNPEPEIRHDEDAHRFLLETEGQAAYLSYRRTGDSTVDFRSTFTPPALRGRGLAGRITRHALDWARDNDLQVVPSCPYVADYIEKNPEYEDLQVSSST